MTAAASRVCACGERVLDIDRGHPERCRGPLPPPPVPDHLHVPPLRLRQPAYRPWDWAGMLADQDAGDRRAAPHLGGEDDDGVPAVGRH